MSMQMNICWLTVSILFSSWICSVHGGNTIKYASTCSVDLCVLKNDTTNNSSNGNVTCPNLPLCYNFDTSLNTSICAPQVICSLFDLCTSAKKCATNTSVCVINTCCSAPICIPLSLSSSCNMYTSVKTGSSWSGTICPNATWEANGTVIVNSNLNGSYYAWFNDFFIDNYNNLYVTDTNSYRVIKYALNNPSVFTTVAVTSVSSTYQAQNIYVDNNGTIYTAESAYISTQYSYRIVKNTFQNGVMNSVVVYGPATCGTGVSDLCGSGGLFVDRAGLIYYSDSSNHRVLKITPLASSATVVAGTSGTSGSQLNQLYNPAGIYVDGNGVLYIADQNNGRVMKYASGSSTGTILFILTSYQAPIGLTLDTGGSIYVGTYNGVFKWIPTSNTVIQIASSIYWGVNRVRFDTYGNLYTGGYSSSNIYRYNITANNC